MEYTRDTLIKKIGEYIGILPNELQEIACEAVDKLEKDEWIPVSERLPSEEGRYLVTYPLLRWQNNWIDLLRYGKPLQSICDVEGNCFYKSGPDGRDVVYENVIAWKPLPALYKGGDAE